MHLVALDKHRKLTKSLTPSLNTQSTHCIQFQPICHHKLATSCHVHPTCDKKLPTLIQILIVKSQMMPFLKKKKKRKLSIKTSSALSWTAGTVYTEVCVGGDFFFIYLFFLNINVGRYFHASSSPSFTFQWTVLTRTLRWNRRINAPRCTQQQREVTKTSATCLFR